MILCTIYIYIYIYIYSNDIFQSHLMFKLHISTRLVCMFNWDGALRWGRTPDGWNQRRKNETNSALWIVDSAEDWVKGLQWLQSRWYWRRQFKSMGVLWKPTSVRWNNQQVPAETASKSLSKTEHFWPFYLFLTFLFHLYLWCHEKAVLFWRQRLSLSTRSKAVNDVLFSGGTNVSQPPLIGYNWNTK